MFRRFGVPIVAFGAALILNISPGMAQSRSGGSWTGRNGNNTAPSFSPLNSNQPQQQYSPNADSQQRGYSNAYQGQQGYDGYSNSRGNFSRPQQQYSPNGASQQRGYSNGYQRGQVQGSYGYGYSRGDSYVSPEYRSYEPRYRGSHESRIWRERMWREHMWRERNRRHGWDW